MGIKFNKEKCIIGLKKVKFLGHVFGREGIEVDPDRVEAIKRIPEPKNAKELGRFLGVITYVSKYVTNSSNVTVNLRELIKKDVMWNWTSQCRIDFQKLKDVVMRAPVIHYIDVDKPVVLSVDSSKDGLGAIILQDDVPVVYASKSLNESQKNYAQIEKEMLAISFGCERFRQYIYGQNVIVETDHKPLEAIFQKTINKCPLRLQRLRVRLQDYDIDVRYKPGNILFIADTLSRVSYNDVNFNIGDESEIQISLIDVTYNITNERLEQIKYETRNYVELNALANVIKNGWPNERIDVLDIVKPYFSIREDLVLCSVLILDN